MSSQRTAGATPDECGFTIIEALIATALLVLVAFAGLTVCKTLGRVSSGAGEDARAATALDDQTADLRSDAASAFAVFVPPATADGGANTGRELDFFSKTDAGRPVFWRYVYDPGAQTLTRSDYDPSGAAGVRDPRTGSIDTAATYPPLTGITRFSATPIAADELGDSAVNAYHGLGGFFARAPRALPVRYSSAAAGVAGVVGGNGVIAVSITSAKAARLVHLVAGSLPTGFTVTGAPVWHAIVYRVDQTHRSWLGVAGKSHVFINARVEVSYDRWATAGQIWCDFNLLGNPGGLDGHDPHADYKPDEPVEQSASILQRCRQQTPQIPPLGGGSNPPDPGSIHPPIPQDTPPPCWTHPGPDGRCWPSSTQPVPPDWQPPALIPGETPPPSFCSAHEHSRLCGVAGSVPVREL